jgi:hypothetical protein
MKSISFSRILAAAGVISLVALTGAALGQSSQDPQAKPKLTIQKLEHNFGEIKKGSVAQHSFVIKNEGKADLEIKNVAPACGCTASDFTKIVPPGQEGKITLSFNSSGFNGAVTKHAEVYTNDPERPQFTLMMSMVVVGEEPPPGSRIGPFHVSPTNEWRGQAPQGTSVNGLITITNASQRLIRITKLEPNGTAFTANLQTLEDGKRYSVGFISSPTLPVGSHTQTLKLKTDSQETPELELHLQVTVSPAVTLNPASLTFENVPVSDPQIDISLISKFMWVRAGRGAGLEIKSITSDLPFVKAKIESVDGSSITLRVGFSEIPPKGPHTGKIKIETNNPNVKTLEAPITINAK